jgi:hypothetical protein
MLGLAPLGAGADRLAEADACAKEGVLRLPFNRANRADVAGEGRLLLAERGRR